MVYSRRRYNRGRNGRRFKKRIGRGKYFGKGINPFKSGNTLRSRNTTSTTMMLKNPLSADRLFVRLKHARYGQVLTSTSTTYFSGMTVRLNSPFLVDGVSGVSTGTRNAMGALTYGSLYKSCIVHASQIKVTACITSNQNKPVRLIVYPSDNYTSINNLVTNNDEVLVMNPYVKHKCADDSPDMMVIKNYIRPAKLYGIPKLSANYEQGVISTNYNASTIVQPAIGHYWFIVGGTMEGGATSTFIPETRMVVDYEVEYLCEFFERYDDPENFVT